MSDTTNSPSPIQTNSQSTFANDPLSLLMQPKPLAAMTQDEIREEVNKLRTLRTGSQSLGRALREGASKKKDKEARAESKDKSVNLDELLGGL